jgi:intein/homing endonuclease
VQNQKELFNQLKDQLTIIDPVSFVERYLTLDGEPFRLHNNGYKPFADIYRYIGIKALEPTALPVILVKGRQVGGTTMAGALEMYFMGSGLFGVGNKPPIRIIHAFPLLELAAAYSKTKLNQMIASSAIMPSDEKQDKKNAGKIKSYMQSLLDPTSPTNDSLHFKQFIGGNHIWIESTGIDADRLMGRMLSLETDLPTPKGFIKLKDLKEGDQLFDEQGNICNVTKLHPIDLNPESYRITFDDGTIVDACKDHLWLTYTRNERVSLSRFNNGKLKTKNYPKIKTTKDILDTLTHLGETNHSIPNCLPLNYPEKELLIDPYLLGLWLGDGDGSGRIESADPEILDNFENHIIPSSINRKGNFGISKSSSYRVKDLTTKLRKLGLLKNDSKKFNTIYDKYIPKDYMESSFKQRLSLVQGLMDTDGHCDKNGNIEFVQIRKELAYQVYDLILSLGIKAYLYKRESRRYNKQYKDKYRIRFTTNLPVFRVKRKLNRLKHKITTNSIHRFIINIEKIKSVPMRCITVDSPSHLYLITNRCIPTHNTADIIFFDECFPYQQRVITNIGSKSIGSLFNDFNKNRNLPLILSFNEESETFEYKEISNIFKRNKRKLVQISFNGRKVKCTENHRFLTSNGWAEASTLIKGSLIKGSIDKGLCVKAINEDQKQIILGSFLGDGHIRREGNSKIRLSVTHGIDQKEYCQWKANMFNCNIKTISNNGYAKTKAVTFCTKILGLNKDFPNTKTSCPQWILDEIDARGIAIWFMDDGSLNNIWNSGYSGRISTCSFDEDSHKRFVEKFKSLGIDCHYKKYDGYYYLFFNKNGLKSLYELISPYFNENLNKKISSNFINFNYKWDNRYKPYCYFVVDDVIPIEKIENVYDLEVKDNHNFILSSNDKNTKYISGPIVHNCQRTAGLALGNALKILTTAKYGKPSKGVQVYFGTPRRKGSDFHKMWLSSSQQYYYLGCEQCKKHFPLYTPESDDWEKIWIYGFIVKCPHCGFEQDKREAAERGKWVALRDHNDEDCRMIGFHINQLYMPTFKREDIDNEKPGKHPINTERIFHTEVLGEFFQGDTSPITPEEIAENCGDAGRKFKARINPGEEQMVVLGIDYGLRADIEQLANPETAKIAGQSYSTAVVLAAKGPGLLSIEFATKFKRNDIESKKGIIDQIMRQYSVQLAIGDIGFSQDLSETLHTIYGDRYLVSRARGKVNNYISFIKDAYPKEISFERDHFIGELYEQMKKGQIRFPYGDWEKIAWLVDHCTSMEIKPSISKTGADPTVHYVKGSTPNDGFMALLNAYLAYKFMVTSGFTNNNPLTQQQNFTNKNKPLALTGFIPRKL